MKDLYNGGWYQDGGDNDECLSDCSSEVEMLVSPDTIDLDDYLIGGYEDD